MFVIAFVGVQGAIEAVICFVVGSILTRTLYKILKAGGVKMNQQNLFFNEIDVNTATNGTLGFKLGHAADNKAKTGVSVIYFPDEGCKGWLRYKRQACPQERPLLQCRSQLTIQ